jgi:hypothetical protein
MVSRAQHTVPSAKHKHHAAQAISALCRVDKTKKGMEDRSFKGDTQRLAADRAQRPCCDKGVVDKTVSDLSMVICEGGSNSSSMRWWAGRGDERDEKEREGGGGGSHRKNPPHCSVFKPTPHRGFFSCAATRDGVVGACGAVVFSVVIFKLARLAEVVGATKMP